MDCFAILMEHTVDVYGPPTVTRDAGGGTGITWPTVRTSGVKIMLNVSGANEQERFSQEGLIGPVTGATFDTSLQRGDKLVVTAGPTLVGVSLHVTGYKSQPGIDALGFSTIVHITGEQILG